jgi:hypothetical protein
MCEFSNYCDNNADHVFSNYVNYGLNGYYMSHTQMIVLFLSKKN